MDSDLIKVHKLLCYSLNADASCVTVGTKSGLYVYNLDPVVRRLKGCIGDGFKIVELLYCTSLLVMVGSGDHPGSSPRTLRLWNSQSKDTIVEVPFDSTIITCKLNKSRLVVYLESQQLHIFDLATMACLQILSTSPNPSGLLSLSREDTSYVAIPGYPGRVVLFDCLSCRLMTQINAHKAALTQIHFNHDGTLLATASETGTVIRVFGIPEGELLFSFRRGIQHATINSLSFCPNSQLLSAGSSNGTIHIFLMTNQRKLIPITKPQSSLDDGTNVLPAAPIDADDENTDSTDLTSETGFMPPPPPSSTSHANPLLHSEYVLDNEGSISSGTTGGWKDTYLNMKSTALTGLVAAVKYVGSLNVLPPVAQEFVDSTRAVCICRLPGGEADFKAALTMTKPSIRARNGSRIDELTGTNISNSTGLVNKVVVATQSGYAYRFLVPPIDELRQRLLNPIATLSHTASGDEGGVGMSASQNTSTIGNGTTSQDTISNVYNSPSSNRGGTGLVDVTTGLFSSIVPSSVTATFSAQDKLLQCELEDEALLPDDDDDDEDS